MDQHTRPDFRRSALLTIDMQRDFQSGRPHGIPRHQRNPAEPPATGRAFRTANRPIVHIVRLTAPTPSVAAAES